MAEKPWDEMTGDERADYNSVYLDNWDTINDAITRHRVRLKADDITPQEEARIDSELLDLQYEMAKLDAKYDARKRPSVAISPPTAEQVAAAKKLAEESDRLIADQAGVVRGFKIAVEAGKLMAAIQPKPAGRA